MNIVNKVKVTICGKDYNLRTDESPEYLIELAKRVDKEINDMVRAKPNFGVQNAAVFVALTSLDEARKASDSIENIRTGIKTALDESAKSRAAKEKLAEKVKALEERIAELEKENKELKKRPPAFECEQLVLENTISPAVTIYAEEKSPEDAASDPKEADAKEKSSDNKETAADNTAQAGDCASKSEGESEEKSVEADKGNDRGGAAETESNADNPQNDDLTAAKNSGRGKRKKR